jgi:redox-sensitive bicupin YhaK (pirin superfamily)
MLPHLEETRMSWLPDQPPVVEAAPCPALETVIVARPRDLGGFAVRRALPATSRQMVGPFIFLDQMGPADFPAGTGIDVRPHPHIGLATVTYLFEGEVLHRDNLGTVQAIRPGAVNWMTAGRGIAHSERSDPVLRQSPQRLSGIQAWVALPARQEETEPAFAHYPQDALPVIAGEGKKVRLIAGSLYGARSPVETLWELFYADAVLAPGARLELPAEHEERAVYVAEGQIEITGQTFEAGGLLVFRPGDAVTLAAKAAARLMLLGGAAMDGPRHIWWNFVSSSRERIEQAKADWQARRFDRVPGDPEFIPLPT